MSTDEMTGPSCFICEYPCPIRGEFSWFWFWNFPPFAKPTIFVLIPPMAGENWFYVQNGQQMGPVTQDALRGLIQSGQVMVSDLVWNETMPNWTAASTVPVLVAPAFSSASIPQQQSQIPQIQPGLGQPQHMGYQPQGYQQPQQNYGQPSYGQQGFQPQPQSGYGHAPMQGQMMPQGQMGQPVNYYTPQMAVPWAGFWLRFVAFAIDMVLLIIVSFVVTAFFANTVGPIDINNPSPSLVFSWLSMLGIEWLYFATMESSASQGTFGKMMLGLKVIDLNGQRISFGKATGRFFAKLLLGTITIGFIYVVVAFTEKKQAVHDFMASTLVIRK